MRKLYVGILFHFFNIFIFLRNTDHKYCIRLFFAGSAKGFRNLQYFNGKTGDKIKNYVQYLGKGRL
jgi:hypothetical protein